MKFNDPTNYQGIVQDIDFWITGKSSVASDCSIEDKTRLSNAALDRICSLIQQADNKWNWDDNNNTDLQIATTNLVEDQRDYGIAGTEFFRVLKVLVKDRAGYYQELKPVSLNSPEGRLIAEDRDTDEGVPYCYIKVGSSIILGSKPDYSYDAGVKIFYQRNIVYFTTSDTDVEPGFNKNYHRLVPLYAARDYCAANEITSRLPILDKEIEKLEVGLIAFYSTRAEDQADRLRLRRESYNVGEDISEESVNWQHKT